MAVENVKIIYQIDSKDIDILIEKFGKLTKEEKEQIAMLSQVDSKMQSTANNTNQSFNKIGSTINKIGVAVVAAFAFDKIKDFTNEVLKTTVTFESLKNAINFASGSVSNGNKNMQFLKDTSDKLGLNLEKASQGFKNIIGAALPAGISMKDANYIFESVSKSVTAMGLSADDANGVFLALGQMISKGTVQSEELRGQIGERLPGAFNLAANAMGVSTQKLNKMLEQGEVLTSDFLPKFAKELDKTFSKGALEATNSLQSQLNRVSNSFYQLQLAIGTQLSGAFSFAIGGINSMITSLTNFIAPAKSVESQVYAEQNALNLLVNQITTTNQGSSERKVLMEKLNAEYPFFLKNMDKENASNEQLIGHLTKVNDLYIKKAFVLAKEKEIKLVMDEITNAAQRQDEAQRKLLQVAQRYNKEGQYNNLISQEQITMIEKQSDIKIRALMIQNALEKGMRKAELEYNENYNLAVEKRQDTAPLRNRIYAFQNELKVVNSAIASYNEENENLKVGNNLIKKRTDEINKQRKELNGIFDDPIEVKKNQTTITKAQYEELEKRLKMLAEFDLRERVAKQKQVIELLELQKQTNQEALQQTNISELKRIKLLNSNFEIDKQIGEAKKNNELNVLEVVENKGKLYSTYSVQRKKLTKTEELNIETNANTALLKTIQDYNLAKEALEKQTIEKERTLAKERRQIKYDSEVDYQNQTNTIILMNELDLLKRSEEAFKNYQERKTNLLDETQKVQLDKRIEFLNVEIDKLLPTELEKKKELENELKKLSKERFDFQLSQAEKQAQKEIEIAQKKQEQIRAIEDKAIEVGRAASDFVFQINQNRIQRELEDIQTQRNYELQLAGDNAQKKNFINAKYAEEERKAKQRQSAADKDKAVFDIFINTSVAAVKSLPNLALAALSIALGGIQLASVLSRPLPKYYKGTENLRRGDNPIGIDTIPILANEGERIVPTEINRKLKGVKNELLPHLIEKAMSNDKITEKQLKVSVSLENLPKTNINFDKNGFNEFIITSNKTTKILNSNNSI